MKVRISTKLFTGFALVVSLMAVLTYYSLVISQGYLEAAAGKDFAFLAEETLMRINQSIYRRVEELQLHARHLMLHKVLAASNIEYTKLDDIESFINKRDKEWRSTPKQDITPFMQKLGENDFSKDLRNDFIEFYENKYGYMLYHEIFVTNKYGAIVAMSGRTSDFRQDDEVWWQIAKNQGYFIGDVEYDESSQSHGITIAIKVSDHDDRFLGTMKVVVGIAGLIREVEIYSKRHETTRIKVITKEGKLIYSSRSFKFMEDLSGTELFKKMNSQNGFFISRAGDRERLYSYSRSKGYREFEGLNWILLISHDVQEVFSPSIALRQKMISASLILIIAGCLIAYLMSRSITSPIRKLIHGTQKLGKGDLEHRVNIKTKDETGELAAAFNEMAENRLKAETALQESDERYRTVADFTYDWEYWIDADGGFRYVSPSCERITGYTVGEFLKNSDLIRKIIHPEDIDMVSKHYQDELTDSEPCSIKFRIVTKNGEDRWMGHVCQPVYDKDGIGLGRRASIRDITDQKQAEEEIKAYVFKLKAANKELEAFSYSVSHDLRAPLRAIDSFARILLEDHAERLDQEGKRVLSIIGNNVQKMGRLIDDLLAFSRLDRKTLKTSQVDMNQLTDELTGELKADFGKRIVNINIKPLPGSKGDRAMLREVLFNLLSNALKFTREKNPAMIEICGSSNNDENIYFIKDNGVGFNMKYAAKLFMVFQRLHSSKEFEGTGIGLALAQRIINKHGGRIWAEGTVGKGATFYFSLPKKGENNE